MPLTVSLALILAWWLHLNKRTGHVQAAEHQSSMTQDSAGVTVINRLFDDILNELDEQGIYYDKSGNPVLSPIDFYISVLDGRVWKCATTMEKRLRNFATRLNAEV